MVEEEKGSKGELLIDVRIWNKIDLGEMLLRRCWWRGLAGYEQG